MPRMPGALPRGVIVLVGLAAATVAAIGLNGIRGIAAPVLFTLVLIICVQPLRVHAESHGVPQGLATASVILATFAGLAGFTLAVLVAVAQVVQMLPRYSGQFEQISRNVSAWLGSLGVGQSQAGNFANAIDPSNLAVVLGGALGGIFGIAGALVIVLSMVILMAADAAYVPTILGQLRARDPQLVAALSDYVSNVRRYMVVTTCLGAVQGVLNALALWMLQVPAALLWGLLAFLCSFIPNVGYFFAIIPPLVFAFLEGGWPVLAAVVVVYAVINGVVQSIVQPRIVGQAVSLSQTVTFFSVLFWVVVIGPIGAIVAIPLTLLGKALLIDSDLHARFWRPVLGPAGETLESKRLADADFKLARKAAHGAAGRTGPGTADQKRTESGAADTPAIEGKSNGKPPA